MGQDISLGKTERARMVKTAHEFNIDIDVSGPQVVSWADHNLYDNGRFEIDSELGTGASCRVDCVIDVEKHDKHPHYASAMKQMSR